MSSRFFSTAWALATLGLPALQGAEPSQMEIRLSELNLAVVQQGVGQAKKNLSIDGQPLQIGGKAFEHGIGTHARSEMRVLLDGKATRLSGRCGLDEASAKDPAASIDFEIIADGAVLWRSGVLKAGSGAVAFDVPLEGAKELRLKVGDAGDGMSGDRADWADAVIRYAGQAPQAVEPNDDGMAAQLPPVKEAPGGPPNAATEVKWESGTGFLQMLYGKRLLMRGTLANGASVENRANGELALEQRVVLTNAGESLLLIVHGGKEAIAAETRGEAQKRFPLIRTASGPSDNLRNNAVYDPEADWMIEFPAGVSRIISLRATDQTMRFEVKIAARDAEIVFRPRYFQRHKNLPYHQPWAFKPRKGTIAGWSVAAAYPEKPGANEFNQALEVWKQKRLGDFGAAWIEFDALPVPAKKPAETKKVSTAPEPAAKPVEPAKPPAFPGGTKTMVDLVKKAGASPAVRVGTDVSVPAGPEAPNGTFFRDLSKQGVGVFRVARLDHYLYSVLHRDLAGWVKQKRRPDETLRAWLTAAKKDSGRDSLLMTCGGVLPETIGLADVSRLGSAGGFSPVALQQYNSWNGIVWRNDPGPCDVLPGGLPVPAEAGAEAKPLTDGQVQAAILRPALVSIAGGVLMLGDKAAVYRDDRLLKGVRRALPVVASVPSQLYDFDDSKTAWFRTGERTDLRGDDVKAPTDADAAGTVCPWWLNEFDTPTGHWNVLHRVNAGESPLAATTVRFADVGIDPKKRYLVHELWSDTFYGVCRDSFDIPALGANGLQSFAIREGLDRPQIVSTDRHVSQGAVDLEIIGWNDSATTLEGRSRVVADERYSLTFDVPPDYRPMDGVVGDHTVEIENFGRYCRLSFVPTQSGSVVWSVRFVR